MLRLRPVPSSDADAVKGESESVCLHRGLQASWVHQWVVCLCSSGQSSGRVPTLICAGTYDEPNCMYKAKDLDHAVAVVGYGTDDAGKDFWIVKNSWSSHWCVHSAFPANTVLYRLPSLVIIMSSSCGSSWAHAGVGSSKECVLQLKLHRATVP